MSSASNTALAQNLGPQRAAHWAPFSAVRQNWLAVGLIIASTLVLYDPVKNFELVNYDDALYANSQVVQGLTWRNFVWSFTAMDASNWHPLTWISYFLDSTIFHASSTGFHYVNLLFHALNIALLFVVLNSATGYRWRSFFVAALFAFHPLNVQSVAWVAERKNVLSTLFFLLALMAYRRYALLPGVKRYALVALCFALGLMAKPMVITLPCVLLLWDVWPLHRWSRAQRGTSTGGVLAALGPPRSLKVLIIEKIPLLALSAASAWLTILAQKRGGALQDTRYFTLSSRFANAAISYAKYLYKTFWPTHLTVFYSAANNADRWRFYLAAVLLVLISLLVLLRERKQAYLGIGWLWYLGTLVPVIGIVQVGDQGMADRYAYIPLIGIFFAFVWAAAEWTQRLPHRSLWLGTAGALVLIALFADSRAQLSVWKNSLTLWSHAVQVDDDILAEFKYGESLEEAGRGSDGLVRFALVAAREPNLSLAHFNYASSLLRNQQPEKAVAEYQLALGGWEGHPEASYVVMRTHYKLGIAYLQVGNLKSAEEQLQQTVHLDPSQYEAHLQLGLLYQRQARCQDAMQPLALSIRMRPSNAAFLGLGICLEQQGKLQEASAAFQAALGISPQYEPAKAKLREVENILARQKNP